MGALLVQSYSHIGTKKGDLAMYIVLELQTTNGTTAVVPPVAFDNLEQAYQKFYTVLAAAAVSSVQIHSATMLNENGDLIRAEHFEHPVEEESTDE